MVEGNDEQNYERETEIGSTKAHQELVKNILLYISKFPYCRAWANNSGVARSMDNPNRIIRFGLKGSSDIIGIYKKNLLAIEVKTGKSKQTPQQKAFMHMVLSQGGVYILARSVQDVSLIIF